MAALTWAGLSAHPNLCLVCRALQNALQRLLCTMAVYLEVEGWFHSGSVCYSVFIIRLSATFLNEGTCPQAIYGGSKPLMKCQLLQLCRDTSQRTGKAIQLAFPVPREGWLDYSAWCQSPSWRTVSLFLGPFLDWEKQSHCTARSQSLRPSLHPGTLAITSPRTSVEVAVVFPSLSWPATFLVKTD